MNNNLPPIGVPDISWSKPYSPESPSLSTPTIPLTDQDIQHNIQLLLFGNDVQSQEASELFSIAKPESSIPLIIQAVENRNVKEVERREHAILTVGKIGGDTAAYNLLRMTKPLELHASICLALGLTKKTAARDYLHQLLRGEIPDKFFTTRDESETRIMKLETRACATLALHLIHSPDSIIPLILDSHIEDLSTDYNYSPFVSGNILLDIAGIVIRGRNISRNTNRFASLMTDPDLTIAMALNLPPTVMKMWMFLLRISILRHFCSDFGDQEFFKALPRCTDSPLQRLMAAIPVIDCLGPKQPYMQYLYEGINHFSDLIQILAYDCFVRLAVRFPNEQYINIVRQAMGKQDHWIRPAITSSVIRYQIKALWPEAMSLLSSPDTDLRIALLFPLHQISTIDNDARRTLQDIASLDTDPTVREIASEMINNPRPAGLEIMGFNIGADPSADVPHQQSMSTVTQFENNKSENNASTDQKPISISPVQNQSKPIWTDDSDVRYNRLSEQPGTKFSKSKQPTKFNKKILIPIAAVLVIGICAFATVSCLLPLLLSVS